MGDLSIVSKLADLENVPYYGELKLSSGTISPIEEKNSCVLTGYDITIQAHDYPAIRCYNSAVYKDTNGQEFFIFCPLSEPNYLMIWKTGSIFSYSRYNNVQYENVYLDTLNYGPITADGATFPYFNYSLDYRNVGGENNVKWIDSLPIFDNLQDFVDYVTVPLEPKGDATCKVTYFLPDDTYEYTKLTYKKDIQPESVNDGTIVNLDPTQDSVTVEGLIENASYWFKIFTSKSESEAFPYVIPVDPVPPEYRTYIDTINGNGFFWKDFTYTNAASPYPAVNPVPATVSFYNRRIWNNTQNPIGNQTNGTGSMMVSSIMTFNITSSNDSFTATLSGYNPEIQEGKTENNIYYIPFEAVDQVFRNIASSINAYTFNNSYRIAVFEYQFNTLQICLQCIATHFRNVNIYVDGVLWTKVS